MCNVDYIQFDNIERAIRYVKDNGNPFSSDEELRAWIEKETGGDITLFKGLYFIQDPGIGKDTYWVEKPRKNNWFNRFFYIYGKRTFLPNPKINN